MINLEVRKQIESVANANGFDPNLIEALIMVESDGNQYAWNAEPQYKYLWDVKEQKPFRALTEIETISETAPPDFPSLAGTRNQEWWGQQVSWGLMQVMGAVGRERGFKGFYLPELCDVLVNLTVGCKHLRLLMSWASGDNDRALCAYNGGFAGNTIRPFRNQIYADKVSAARFKIKKERG